MAHVFMLVAGLGLLAWNAWQRRGGSPAAREWASPRSTAFSRRNVLVLWPLLGVALLLGAALGVAEGGASTVVGLLLLAVLALWLAYAVFPLPAPGWTRPRWYPHDDRRRVTGRA